MILSVPQTDQICRPYFGTEHSMDFVSHLFGRSYFFSTSSELLTSYRIWSKWVSTRLLKTMWECLSCQCYIYEWYSWHIAGATAIHAILFLFSLWFLGITFCYVYGTDLQHGVLTERCYGCGRCFPVCPYDKISESLPWFLVIF